MGDPKDLKVVIAAGGTGGHLFPGIAVAREFQARHQAAVTFLTTPKAVSTQILDRYGFAWEAVSSRALKGEGLLSRGRTLLGVPGAVLAARARLKALNPHLVLGMGGYAAGPVGVAAWLLNLPLALHEQNAIPGATNRWLARLARKIFVSFPASRDFFPPGRSLWTGNPIRPEFFEAGEPRADSPFTVMITGGSQGAHAINMAVLAGLPGLADLKDRLAFLHLTGEADREAVAGGVSRARIYCGSSGLQPGNAGFNAPGPPPGLPGRGLHPGGTHRGGPGRHPGALPLRGQQPPGV
jgi:UDP-N-acetylglucosamine--N-acetylmuramyl-(pentapeptide) pyrophosphoryl-undecaprenol N-acetylglucosamine transferase